MTTGPFHFSAVNGTTTVGLAWHTSKDGLSHIEIKVKAGDRDHAVSALNGLWQALMTGRVGYIRMRPEVARIRDIEADEVHWHGYARGSFKPEPGKLTVPDDRKGWSLGHEPQPTMEAGPEFLEALVGVIGPDGGWTDA